MKDKDTFHSVVSEEKLKMYQLIRGQASNLGIPIGPRNTNLLEHINILLLFKIYCPLVCELIGVSSPPWGIFADLPQLKEHYIRNIISHVSTPVIGAFRIFGVKREKLMQKSLKIGNNYNFFLKADIENQYIHLDSTFDAHSNGTNYKFQFHR